MFLDFMSERVMVKEQDLQRILFRFNPSDELSHHQLNTVTYGTSSASFLAIRSLRQVAIDNVTTHPQASNVIQSSFYVDDLLSGSDPIEHAKEQIFDLIKILQPYGFNLRKFVANDNQILRDVSIDKSYSNQKIISDDETIKTLGLTWNSVQDTFRYSVNVTPSSRVAKRTILSITTQIFDLLGLVGPCIIRVKLILRELWQLGVDWDEGIPMELHRVWAQFADQISLINDIHIPRYISCPNPVTIELHCFNSTIVLSWMALQPNQLQTFVANRVSEIQQFSRSDQWHHVSSENKPADIISRGASAPQNLKSSLLWWHGPAFLMQDKISFNQGIDSNEQIPDLKKIISYDLSLIDKFSSFSRLQRVTAYCLRFITNLKSKDPNTRLLGTPSRQEMSNSLIVLCKLIWSTQYISTLQERSKWNKQFPNLTVGSIVLIKDENSAPLTWKTGSITEVNPGSDGVVRVVSMILRMWAELITLLVNVRW
ncbi:hypothetical protein NQ317_007451 [Molorchus minor]|uniref:DUF5641 domain-containing protein n=1 Tax=Molorchus minor TaxID=1323400 RepID=A0ABQ9JGR7_9CUCU|nr:hypothetical protein NQ317_007451 [Molorchus minor]